MGESVVAVDLNAGRVDYGSVAVVDRVGDRAVDRVGAGTTAAGLEPLHARALRPQLVRGRG